uniref:Uncharacterized protein n=2 Tax=Physcomitrium patens TaxID=3218 RepID=A0A7I4DU61_PHYPA
MNDCCGLKREEVRHGFIPRQFDQVAHLMWPVRNLVAIRNGKPQSGVTLATIFFLLYGRLLFLYDCWSFKSKLPHATIFKHQQPYKRCPNEVFKEFPVSSLTLLDTLLAIEPADCGSATRALASEFFTTKPLACDQVYFPCYTPQRCNWFILQFASWIIDVLFFSIE